MTAGLGRRPNNDAEWARRVEDRLRRLEQASTARSGEWVIKPDPVTRKLQAVSPDATHDLTPDPALKPDIVSGIMPGVFSAARVSTDTGTAYSGDRALPDDWYDTVVLESDRMLFDAATNTVTVLSTALLAVRVSQRIAGGGAGERAWRATVSVLRNGEDTPVLVSHGTNGWYAEGAELVVADTALIAVSPGDAIIPGYWCSENAGGGYLCGEATGSKTGLTIGRVIDL